MGRKFLLVLAMMPVVAPAASFSLGAVLRVGGAFDIEMQLGSNSGSPVVASPFFPFWIDGLDQPFQLSYNALTNTASLAASWIGPPSTTLNWTVAGGSASTDSRSWTLAAGALVATAVNNPLVDTSIQLSNLQLTGPGMAVINAPSLLAAQTGSGTVTASNAAPITFVTPTGGGSWVLSGTIRFSGLGATGDDLRATFDLIASDVTLAPVPEPESLLLSALGLAGLGVLHHFRARRRARVVSKVPQAGTSSKC